MFRKEKKGFDCIENEDGSATCKRIMKDKQGNIVYDGQEITIIADPSQNCQPRFIGNLTVMDEELGNFEEMGKKVSAGCKRNIRSGGYT